MPVVEEKFRVIESEMSRTVVIDKEFVQRLESYQFVHRREIMDWSTQIWASRDMERFIEEIPGRDGLFYWNAPYDNFLGYMSGILTNQQ